MFRQGKRRGEQTPFGNVDEGYPPYPIKPDIQRLEEWNLQELIYVVGLPIEFDQLQPTSVQAYNDKLANWIKRFNTDDIIRPKPGEAEIDTWKRKVNIDRWKEWKQIGNYILADERDTALGISKGNRPFVLDFLSYVRKLSPHPFRKNREHLDKFFMNLQAVGIPTPIGKVWGPSDPGYQNKGKDRRRVVVLCRGSSSAGAGAVIPDELISMSISDTVGVEIDRTASSPETKIVPHKLPSLRNLSPIMIVYCSNMSYHIPYNCLTSLVERTLCQTILEIN